MQKTLLLSLFSCAAQCLVAQSWFATGQSADLMVSGLGFNFTGGAAYYNHPGGVASDGTRLLVCDRFNNRILVWNTAPASADTPPDFVLGQPDFNSNNPGTGKHQLNWAGNASLAPGGKLAVADTENDRILLWNTFPQQNAQAADVSLFLPGFTPAGSGLLYGWPWGVWTDGARVAAVATSGGALLFWNAWPSADNTPPDYSIQLSQFGTPRNISTDGSSYFFVGDHNARINNGPGTFFWNSYPSAPNQPFDFYRDEWIKGEKLPSGQLVAGGLSSIYIWNTVPAAAGQNPDLTLHPPMYKNGDGVDVTFAGNRLYVNNYNGNNVLVFNAIPNAPNQLPDFAVGAPGIHAQTLDSIRYIQNPVPATDGTRLIVSSDFDRTIHVWNQFPAQSGSKSDQRIAVSPQVDIWANTLFGNKFVVAGRKSVSIWDNAAQLSATPDRTYANQIGSAVFTDLGGVALDAQFFYLADKSGNLYGWAGLPANASVNPAFAISNPGAQYGFLYSDGQYLCVTQPNPPSRVLVYKVAELAAGNTAPYKIVGNTPGIHFNQAYQAITFGNALAVACRGSNAVYLWDDLADTGDPSKMVALGQPAANSQSAAIGPDRLFMPSALAHDGAALWVGEFKFSSRLLKFSPGTSAVRDVRITEQNLGVYPNPVTETATLHIQPAFSDVYTADLFDARGKHLGRLFSTELLSGELFRFSFSVNQFSIPAGISFIRIFSRKSRGVAKIVRAG